MEWWTYQTFELKSTDGDIKLKSAELDADGKATDLKSQTFDIRLEREQVKKLAQGEKMIVTSELSTPRNKTVQLSLDNEIQLQIGVKVKAGLPIEDLY